MHERERSPPGVSHWMRGSLDVRRHVVEEREHHEHDRGMIGHLAI